MSRLDPTCFMSLYEAIKFCHVGAVILSGILFGLRGICMLWRPAVLRLPVVRVGPHLVDTVLLGSAIALSVMSRQYPGTDGWLTSKVVALLMYIVLGSIALTYGRTRAIRSVALLAAVAVFAYIVGVALHRNPLSWLA